MTLLRIAAIWWGLTRLISTLARLCGASWRGKPNLGEARASMCWCLRPLQTLRMASLATARAPQASAMPASQPASHPGGQEEHAGWHCGLLGQKAWPAPCKRHFLFRFAPACPRSKLPTHHPEDRNSVYPRSSTAAGSSAPASPASTDAGGSSNGCAPGGAGGAAAEMVAATSGAVGSVDPKAQDLQFLFLAMTEEVGAGPTGRCGRCGRCECCLQGGRMGCWVPWRWHPQPAGHRPVQALRPAPLGASSRPDSASLLCSTHTCSHSQCLHSRFSVLARPGSRCASLW